MLNDDADHVCNEDLSLQQYSLILFKYHNHTHQISKKNIIYTNVMDMLSLKEEKEIIFDGN
jgi:hypothetical protein